MVISYTADHKTVGNVSYFLPVIRVDGGCYYCIFNSDRSNKYMLFWRSSIIKANGYYCRGVFNNECAKIVELTDQRRRQNYFHWAK